MSIIKRKKQDKFFIMSNEPAQKDLESLASIGLLAYIISLPADFKLYKTYLQNKFTRRTVDGAFKELTEKCYIAGFSAYVNRKKSYYYIAGDEKITEREFNMFVHECFYETLDETGFIPKNLQVINDCPLKILIDFSHVKTERISSESSTEVSTVQNVQHSDSHGDFTNVQYVQYSEYSTSSTVPDVPVQINNTNKILKRNITNINNNKDVPEFYNWLES